MKAEKFLSTLIKYENDSASHQHSFIYILIKPYLIIIILLLNNFIFFLSNNRRAFKIRIIKIN